jgi:sugar/nucleoside kinase (ribokinase family)
MTMDIVVVGELNIDLVLTGLPSLPGYRELRLARDMRFALGSSSAIFACNAARLGASVGFVGKVGDDEFGDFMLRSLQQAGVDTSRIIRHAGGRTGICVVMSFPEDYAMVSFPGIRETFRLEEVDFDYVKTARHLHMSSFYIQPALRPEIPQLFRWARQAGLSTSLDPDNDPTGGWNGGMRGTLTNVDLFLPNEQELMGIAGKEDLNAAVEEMRGLAGTTIVKRGAAGVLVATRSRTITAPGFAIKPLDTTGAGDSFNAGFVFRFLNGAPIDDCVTWGNACGALSTQALGGTAGFPDCGELQRFLAERSGEREKIRNAFMTGGGGE